MSKYEVNIKRFALLLLPTFWRKPILAAFAYAMVWPLVGLHTRFILFRRDTVYRLTHNGQVCHLRAVLNDKFDPIERRMTISDEAASSGVLMLHMREEEQTFMLPARVSKKAFVINRRGFDGINGFDFWVNIPMSLRDAVDVYRLRAIVDTYKLASKRFSVNYI